MSREMIEITTSSSMIVNPLVRLFFICITTFLRVARFLPEPLAVHPLPTARFQRRVAFWDAPLHTPQTTGQVSKKM